MTDILLPPSAEEEVRRWSLPRVARNPLFGLPELPAMDQRIPSDRNHLHFGAGETEAQWHARVAKLSTPELAARRTRYEELNALMPPFSFEGRLPDPSTWRRRDARVSPAISRRVCPVTVRGTVIAASLRSLVLVNRFAQPRALVRGVGPPRRLLERLAQHVLADVGGGDRHLHNNLHGAPGDGMGLGPDDETIYRETATRNARRWCAPARR